MRDLAGSVTLIAACGSLLLAITCAGTGTLGSGPSDMPAAAERASVSASAEPAGAVVLPLPGAASARPVQALGPSPQPPPSSQPSPAAMPSAALPELSSFYAALGELKDKRRATSVRVSWFGDSHTAADILPNALRRALQRDYGSGGPGFTHVGLFGHPHAGFRQEQSGKWLQSPVAPSAREQQVDGIFGLSGIASIAKTKTSTARLSLRGLDPEQSVSWQICYRLDPGAGFEVRLGERSLRISAAASPKQPLPADLVLAAPHAASCTRLASVRAAAGLSLEGAVGEPRILGAIAENDAPGVVVDTLGIVGARLATLLAWDETNWSYTLRSRDPDLVILAYGTNEVFDAVKVERYSEQYRQVLGRIRRAAPRAACLLLGPEDALDPNGGTRPRVPAIDQVQANVARELGCAYVSAFELMGGAGSFSRWMTAQPALARRDGIHLTPAGYERLGEVIARRILGGN